MYCATYLGISGGENNDHVEVSLAANLKKYPQVPLEASLAIQQPSW